MLTRTLFSLGAVLAVSTAIVACSSSSAPGEPGATADQALTTDSIGLVCRTLGEVGQCGSSPLCRAATTGTCKAKDFAYKEAASWEHFCNGWGTEQMCGYANQYCLWDTGVSCVPATGASATAGPIDLPGACSALGELGACSGVSVCAPATAGVCRATDDAIALDPQWQQMCPQAGTSPEACEAEGTSCIWDNVQTCSQRGSGTLPLDVGTACKTLGQSGACGLASSLCKARTMGLCSPRPDVPAKDWQHFCNGYQYAENCGYTPQYCQWSNVTDCIPVTGAHQGAGVDAGKACDTFGQLGMCSRMPICKVVASAACKPTPGALAADPAVAGECAAASTSKDACDFLGASCAWTPVAMCIPR